jgi:hypothetical protein
MDGISALITIIFLLLLAFLTLLMATAPFGILCGFFLLTIIAYITIYSFDADT